MMQFVKLYQNKQYIDQLCDLMLEEWKHYGISNEYLHEFYSKQNSNSLPLTFLLLSDNILIGFFTLHIKNKLTLSDVFVRKEYRNHGLGTMIVSYAKTYAFSVLHHDSLTIWMLNKSLTLFYKNLGFEYSSTKNVNGREHIVMECYDDGVRSYDILKLLYILVIMIIIYIFLI